MVGRRPGPRWRRHRPGRAHEEVAERISEYADLGIDHFILSGYPHLEEAWQFAEGVVPTLARRGLISERAVSDDSMGVPFASSS